MRSQKNLSFPSRLIDAPSPSFLMGCAIFVAGALILVSDAVAGYI